jgi:hypothetical protein
MPWSVLYPDVRGRFRRNSLAMVNSPSRLSGPICDQKSTLNYQFEDLSLLV